MVTTVAQALPALRTLGITGGAPAAPWATYVVVDGGAAPGAAIMGGGTPGAKGPALKRGRLAACAAAPGSSFTNMFLRAISTLQQQQASAQTRQQTSLPNSQVQ